VYEQLGGIYCFLILQVIPGKWLVMEKTGESAIEGEDWPIRSMKAKNGNEGPLISVHCKRAVKFIQESKKQNV
jgi:hypothetical protein